MCYQKLLKFYEGDEVVLNKFLTNNLEDFNTREIYKQVRDDTVELMSIVAQMTFSLMTYRPAKVSDVKSSLKYNNVDPNIVKLLVGNEVDNHEVDQSRSYVPGRIRNLLTSCLKVINGLNARLNAPSPSAQQGSSEGIDTLDREKNRASLLSLCYA